MENIWKVVVVVVLSFSDKNVSSKLMNYYDCGPCWVIRVI